MQTIQTLIETHGGLAALKKNYLRIANPPWMRLVIEVVGGPFPTGSWELSVAHYGEQNGDAMRDPEITFLVQPQGRHWTWVPLTFLNDYLGTYQVAAARDEQGRCIEQDAPLTASLREFSRQWDANLLQQGFLEVFTRQHRGSSPDRAGGTAGSIE